MKTIVSLGKQGVFEIAFATHAGMTEEAFDAIAMMKDAAGGAGK